MRIVLLAFACIALAACQQETDPGPGGVTVGEAKALDEAAEMLEDGRPDLPERVTSDTPTDNGAALEGRSDALPAPEESGGPEPASLPLEN